MFRLTQASTTFRAVLAAGAVALFASQAAVAAQPQEFSKSTAADYASRAGTKSDKGVSAEYASRAGTNSDKGVSAQYA